MIIKVGDVEIEALSIHEQTDSNGRETIRVILPGGVSATKQDALRKGNLDIDDGYVVYKGYTELVEHAITLARPQVDVGELEAELKALRAELRTAKAELKKAVE